MKETNSTLNRKGPAIVLFLFLLYLIGGIIIFWDNIKAFFSSSPNNEKVVASQVFYPVVNSSTGAKQKTLFFELADIGEPEPNGYVQVNPETNELEYDLFTDAFDTEL